jgi:predicted transcriptional regulator
MSKKSPESKKITGVRLEPDVKEKLEQIAVEMDRSVSWLIRNAVNEWVKAYKPARKTPAPF